jgi:hypothetical protein
LGFTFSSSPNICCPHSHLLLLPFFFYRRNSDNVFTHFTTITFISHYSFTQNSFLRFHSSLPSTSTSTKVSPLSQFHSFYFHLLRLLTALICYYLYRSIKFQHKWKTIECKVATNLNPPPSTSLTKEPHKYFDQVVITVRGGDGGHGAILNQKPKKEVEKVKGRKAINDNNYKKSALKRDFDGSLILPMGGHGGDVVIYADESKDTLLEFHNKNRFNAKRGGNVDAVGVFTSYLRNGTSAPTVRIPVPLGLQISSFVCYIFLFFGIVWINNL